MTLIIGATGNVGKELIPQLLERGEPIRVISRDARKVAHLDPRVERIVGDLDKPETMVAALEGIERMLLITFQTQQVRRCPLICGQGADVALRHGQGICQSINGSSQ